MPRISQVPTIGSLHPQKAGRGCGGSLSLTFLLFCFHFLSNSFRLVTPASYQPCSGQFVACLDLSLFCLLRPGHCAHSRAAILGWRPFNPPSQLHSPPTRTSSCPPKKRQ